MSNQAVGLKNGSFKCFVNSVRQAIFYNRPFHQFISAETETECTYDINDNVFCLKCELKRILRRMKNVKLGPFDAAKRLIQRLTFVNGINFNRQSDANEFMMIALNQTIDDFAKNHPVEFADICLTAIGLYKCHFSLSYKCEECGSVSYRFEESEMIPIFANNGKQNLCELLRSYIGTPNDCVIPCDECGGRTKETRVTTESPDCLIVTIFNTIGNLKNGHNITIPTSFYLPGLCREFCYRYDLSSAVCHHSDSTEYGHYTAIVRQKLYRWLIADDEKIQLGTRTKSIRRSLLHAYVLLFQRSICFNLSTRLKLDLDNRTTMDDCEQINLNIGISDESCNNEQTEMKNTIGRISRGRTNLLFKILSFFASKIIMELNAPFKTVIELDFCDE
ncbi:hypothetical protein ACOME3_002431 [Neoechinorhynchus agilis]